MPTKTINLDDLQSLLDEVLDFNTVQELEANIAIFNDEISGLSQTKQKQAKLKLMDAAKAEEKLGYLRMTPEITAAFNTMNLSGIAPDEISDEEAYRRSGRGTQRTVGHRPRTDQNKLPAVISKEIARTGTARLNPEWIAVRQLPGYLKNAIRSMGRGIFRAFTDVKLEDIYVVAHLNGAGGPHTMNEMKFIANQLQKRGTRKVETELEMQEILPGYRADIRIFELMGFDFMVVKDPHGYYVYGYVAKTKTALEGNKNRALANQSHRRLR